MSDTKHAATSADVEREEPRPDAAAPDPEFGGEKSKGSFKFAILWFGIPLILLVLLLVLRRPG